jgi:hypothetical protein
MRPWNGVREKVTVKHADGMDLLCQSGSVIESIYEVIDGGKSLFRAWKLVSERMEVDQQLVVTTDVGRRRRWHGLLNWFVFGVIARNPRREFLQRFLGGAGVRHLERLPASHVERQGA